MNTLQNVVEREIYIPVGSLCFREGPQEGVYLTGSEVNGPCYPISRTDLINKIKLHGSTAAKEIGQFLGLNILWSQAEAFCDKIMGEN